jgi:hypothetical protein
VVARDLGNSGEQPSLDCRMIDGSSSRRHRAGPFGNALAIGRKKHKLGEALAEIHDQNRAFGQSLSLVRDAI